MGWPLAYWTGWRALTTPWEADRMTFKELQDALTDAFDDGRDVPEDEILVVDENDNYYTINFVLENFSGAGIVIVVTDQMEDENDDED